MQIALAERAGLLTSESMSYHWLAHVDPATAWAHRVWSEFAHPSERTLALLPLHGIADHGLGLPLDAEEAAGAAVVRSAVVALRQQFPLLVLPPWRFTLAPYPHTFFGLDPETAHDALHELAESVRLAGVSKLIFFNTSPWHEELIDAASRDIRVGLGLPTFIINLNGLGLDFHPASAERAAAQAVAALALGQAPAPAASLRPGDVRDADFRPGAFWQPAPLLSAPAVDAASASDASPAYSGSAASPAPRDGAALLVEAAQKLAELLQEIARHPSPRARREVSFTRPPFPEGTPIARPLVPPAECWPTPTLRARYLPALTRDELEALPAKEQSLVIVATGAIEQHGHHLPVGVDAILGQALLDRALAQLPATAAVYLAPPLTYGKSNEHHGFAGTLSLSAKTLRRQVLAHARQLHALGFRRMAILNTHGGNSSVLVYTLREVQVSPGLRAGMLSGYYRPVQGEQEAAYGFHAGEWETALMQACAPDLVRMDRAVCEYPAQVNAPGQLRPENAPAVFSWKTSDVSVSGVMGDPTLATAEQGERWLAEAAAALAGRIVALLG